MYFGEKFLNTLTGDSNSAIINVCNEFFRMRSELKSTKEISNLIVETYAFAETLLKDIMGLDITVPEIANDFDIDFKRSDFFIKSILEKAEKQKHIDLFQEHKNRFRLYLGKGYRYEFSEGDLKRIQKIINELRDLISATEDLEAEHKRRLLRRLEKLQSEFHKKVSDLDAFWGFLIEASITIGLMGENVKPMVDRIKELKEIIWPVQTRAYELSSDLPFKLLGQPEEKKS
jgi:hypothetical protein